MRQKTQARQVYDEELGRYEWKEVETDKYIFDETDKIAIAREYHERRCPASDIVSKYHISSAVVLYGWFDKYLNEKVCVSLQPETDNETDMSKKSKQQLEEELKEMKAENKLLQEALELEKLRSRAFDTMVDVAEEMFGIEIRKKPAPDSRNVKNVQWTFDSEAENQRRRSEAVSRQSSLCTGWCDTTGLLQAGRRPAVPPTGTGTVCCPVYS